MKEYIMCDKVLKNLVKNISSQQYSNIIIYILILYFKIQL